MIKLVAFDWNGTILSDTVAAWKAGNEVFKLYNNKPISIEDFRRTFTIPIKDMWVANGFDASIDFFKQSTIYHPVYEKFAAKSRTRAGARSLLTWLKSHHFLTMIFSNHVTPEIIKQLLRLDIYEYFDEVLARDAGDHSHVKIRSKDQKLFDYVRLHKMNPAEVVVVGDSEEEIQIGKTYGYHTVAITGGYNTRARLAKNHPDFLINNLAELKGIVQKLNK